MILLGCGGENMGIEEDKICIKRVKNMIEGKYYTVNYIEGYIDALLDVNSIDDNEFEELNKILSKR